MLFDDIQVEDLQDVWFQDGFEEGREEGREEGERIGLEKGVEAGKLEDAFTMYQDGVKIDNIVKWTGLDIALVERAINERYGS